MYKIFRSHCRVSVLFAERESLDNPDRLLMKSPGIPSQPCGNFLRNTIDKRDNEHGMTGPAKSTSFLEGIAGELIWE